MAADGGPRTGRRSAQSTWFDLLYIYINITFALSGSDGWVYERSKFDALRVFKIWNYNFKTIFRRVHGKTQDGDWLSGDWAALSFLLLIKQIFFKDQIASYCVKKTDPNSSQLYNLTSRKL